ncbi:amino acid ABC transporter permease [Rhodopirellula sp. P2]|nr:amino acid ABC transporter permease [Rhodopirellula sp. P2]WDQ18120.1 amino acid ABC transporter permease [Rhodopirellula sp. P2]
MPNIPLAALVPPGLSTPDPSFADDWATAIATTIELMLVSAGIAILIGVPTAFFVSQLRPNHWLVRTWTFFAFVTLAMPLILLAAAWESTAGKFGWLVTTMTGGNLGWVGWIHGMHGVALVSLATVWATRRISPVAIQQASLDFSPNQSWWRVRLPIALPWIVASVIAVMVLASTEMSVADLHSVRTVADQFYLFYSVDPNTTSVLVSTLVPMVVGGVPALLWFWLRRRRWNVASHGELESTTAPPRSKSAAWESTTTPGMHAIACVGVTICTLLLLLPLAGLVVQTGHTVEVVDGQRQATFQWQASIRAITEAPRLFQDEIVWTIQLALFSILWTLPIAIGLARWARSSNAAGVVIDVLGTMLFLVPGPVIGMTVAAIFRLPFPGLDWLATHTLVPTLIAVGVRSVLVAYAILRNAYGGIDDATWLSGRMDGSVAWRWWHLELPLLRRGLSVAALAVAIVSAGDVPAAMPALPPGVTTTGTRLFGLLHSGARYQEASLAMVHTGMVILLCGAILAARLHLRRSSKGVD